MAEQLSPEWAYLGPRGPLHHREGGEPSPEEWAQRARGHSSDGNPMRRRDTGDAQRACLLRLLLAWIDAHGSGDLSMAQFESAWMRLSYDIASQEQDLGSIADLYLPADVSPTVRSLFQLPSNQLQARLIGERDEAGIYQLGLAQLAEREFDVLRLWLEPIQESDRNGIISLRLRNAVDIARDVVPDRLRRKFGRSAHLSVDSVERYLANARRKLRSVLVGEDPVNSCDLATPNLISGAA